jgi:hypothetical protein
LVSRHARGPVAAIIGVVAIAIVVGVLLARGGGPSDEQAIRAWFASAAGGNAPRNIVSAIHVDDCSFNDVTSQSRAVLMCKIATDAPNPHAPYMLRDLGRQGSARRLAALRT